MSIPDFTAIDFETATGSSNSACSIGIVRFENEEVNFSKHFYIQPPENKYSFHNIQVHGIYSKTTANSPTFDIVWDEIRKHIEGKIVVAHNAAFDRNVLEKTLKFYAIRVPDIEWHCTYQLTGKNLMEACAMYDVQIRNHHNALSDAFACGEIFLKILRHCNPKENYSCPDKNKINDRHVDREYLKPDLKNCDTESLLFNKKVVISGIFDNYSRNEIAKLLHENGAIILTGVSGKTNYILAGSNMGPAKKEKAEKLSIPIISEEDFENMIQ